MSPHFYNTLDEALGVLDAMDEVPAGLGPVRRSPAVARWLRTVSPLTGPQSGA